MKQAGVVTLQINGRQPVKENVARIIELLKNIETTRGAEPVKRKEISKLNFITQSW